MNLSFESDLQYQLDAVKSVTDLFDALHSEKSLLDSNFDEQGTSHSMLVVGNNLPLTSRQLLDSLNAVRKRNGLTFSEELDGMHFSVEMETGTGKTYVYLRTIYELNKQYSLKKFIIVVPSVAIREGVLKNLEITHEHFQNLYDNVPVRFSVYDSGRVSSLRGFAANNTIEIMVINIDSFAKDENIINKSNDKLNGRKPLEFIQAVKPIVIVDEPQNMETQKRISAIKNLNYLCTLRYSATHRNQYNLVYSLNPVKAYDLGLVKQVEVDSIMEEDAFNDAFISVNDIKVTKTKIKANVTIRVNEQDGVKRRKFWVEPETNLYKLSNERAIYSEKYIIKGIDTANECITLENGDILFKGDTQGGFSEEILKFQIRKTVEEHLNKEKRYTKKGIKVLSLFFIDKVANYRQYDSSGNPCHGKFAEWFEEIYIELISKPAFKDLDKFPLSQIHHGYFSKDRKGKLKDTSGVTHADNDTYSLIMRDKERLLDINNSLRFIFSHSALREGWDNPNVFQICTLNNTQSDLKKRQEIGRGLRLAVDQTGRRIRDKNINRLTIVANESYDDFAKALQKEIEEDCGVSFKVRRKRDRIPIKYRKGFEADKKFLELWERIKQKTTYQVNYDTQRLIDEAANTIKDLSQTKAPSLRSVKTAVTMNETEGVGGKLRGVEHETPKGYTWEIPDLLGIIQNNTGLTRSTIHAILCQSKRIGDALINPQRFIDRVTQSIKGTLYEMMIDGIEYHRIGDAEYEMRLFEDQELEIYLNDFTFRVPSLSKTIYEEFLPLDSSVENRFAQDCESSEQIKFYLKLPSWFKILTPIGSYNPDWALVLENESKIYFVAETKDTGTNEVKLCKLKPDEQLKIKCATAHFEEFNDLEYQVVNKVEQLMPPQE